MVLLLLRLVLAAVLAVAGTAKLLDRDGARDAAVGFAVAASLGPAATAQGAALAAVALLMGFSAAIGVAIVRGRRVECHCFGALSSSVAGPATLVRNLALLAAAGAVAAAGPGTSLTALDGAWNAVAALAAALVLVVTVGGVALLRILRAHGRSLARVDRLEALMEE